MWKPRILLADDHVLVLQSLRELLGQDYQIVGAVQDGYEILRCIKDLQTDLLLLDISMPTLDGFKAAQQVRAKFPQIKIIFVTMHTEPTVILEAFQVGASGYVLKQSAASELHRAIQTVLHHERFLTSDIPASLREKILAKIEGIPTEDLSGHLTKRQQTVLGLLAKGCTSKEISNMLHISLSTVAFHKTNIMHALGIHTSAELTKYAVEKGLTELHGTPRSLRSAYR